MIVFPQGGVLRMATSVGAGQMLVLTNLKSKQDAICRVLKVRSFPNMQAYVEVEFTHPQPGYWGVHFPSASSSSAAKPAPSVGPLPAALPVESKPAAPTGISWAPASTAPPPKPVETLAQSTVMPPKPVKPITPVAPPSTTPLAAPPPAVQASPASSFVSIGAQEKVQPAADSTREVKAAQLATTIEKEIRAAQPPVALEAVEPQSASLSLAELRGDEDAISSVLASLDSEAKPPLTKIAGEPAPLPREGAGVAFGARLDIGVGAPASQAEPGQNWLLIAACIGVLFLAVAGGVWYFRLKPATTHSTAVRSQQASQVSTSSATQPGVSQQPVQQSPVSAESNPAPARVNPAPAVTVTATPAPTRTAKETPAPQQPSATVVAEDQPGQKVAPNPLATAMDAHPLSSQRAVSENEAPALDPGLTSSAQPSDLPGVGETSVIAPPAADPNAGTQPAGSKIEQPKLISSPMPVYPPAARQARVEGDVVVDTQIDKSGRVVGAKAVSGPALLRQAAVDAVRRWKYQPSTLDGQPVPIEMMVTVRFRL